MAPGSGLRETPVKVFDDGVILLVGKLAVPVRDDVRHVERAGLAVEEE
jgi:hypothetical protein